MYLQKVLSRKTNFLLPSCQPLTKKQDLDPQDSGTEPDLYRNVTDLQHWQRIMSRDNFMPSHCLQQVTIETVISNKMLSFKILPKFYAEIDPLEKDWKCWLSIYFRTNSNLENCLPPIQQSGGQKMVSTCKIASKTHQPRETERKLKMKEVCFAFAFCILVVLFIFERK
jgi:hypothetical protein